MKAITVLILIMILLPWSLTAEEEPVSLAVLPFENMNGIPEQDYLRGIISSLLIEDLSGTGALTIVERENLEEVMKEQKLQFTGLIDDEGAIKAGRLLGASYMLKGGFVFLGQDIFINITLIDVETGTTRTFSERGYQENTVHSLAEELLKHMTGRDFSLTGSRGDRSILAMEQQEPGTVELFSMIIDARVYIDEEFAGYTTGDSTVPLVLTVPPGRHSIRVHLSKDFGVIDTPEVTFRDWEEEFHLMPGEKIILEDRTRHFNDRLYRMVQVLRESARIVPGSEEVRQVIHSAGFTDREGEDVEISLSLLWEETATPAKGGRAVITLIYQGESYNFDYFSPAGKDSEFKEEIGKIRFEADLECRSDFYWDLDYSIRRTDIRQGMHRE